MEGNHSDLSIKSFYQMHSSTWKADLACILLEAGRNIPQTYQHFRKKKKKDYVFQTLHLSSFVISLTVQGISLSVFTMSL